MSSTDNFIGCVGSPSSNELPTSQPINAALWLNNGVLTFWSGTGNKIMDFDEGDNTSVFGTPVGDE